MTGVLFLIVGPSGSGKDTLIDYVSERLPIKKIKRVITRKSNSFEDFNSVKPEDFERMQFFLKWSSFDKLYGIPLEVLEGLRKGENYIINVSREVISHARSNWENTIVVSLTASDKVIKERLLARGRDSLEEIEKRLARGFSVESDLVIDTSSPDITIAGEKLVNYIKEII